MAEVKIRICDRKGCKRENARTFRTFAERKMDGAGSMENWSYVFDLCTECAVRVMEKALDALGPEASATLLRGENIKTELG